MRESELKSATYNVCKNCLMDTTAANIEFNSEGICNFCREFEKRNDVLQFYMQFSINDETKNLTISNKILYKSYDNQKNLILYRSKLTRKSFIQSKNKHTNQINF